MDEQRAEFEAWAKSKGAPKDGWWIRQIDDGGYSCHAVDMAWDAWQAATQRQQERIAELEAQVQALSVDAGRQPPADWNVFNSGAEVASGLSWAEAMEYMTPARLDRGWSFVCVADKSNLDAAIAAGKGDA